MVRVDGVELQVEPCEWEMVYPARVEPIGRIRRRRDGFHAKLDEERLGIHSTGDAAAEAVWRRYVAAAAAQHAHASITHGGRERHQHG